VSHFNGEVNVVNNIYVVYLHNHKKQNIENNQKIHSLLRLESNDIIDLYLHIDNIMYLCIYIELESSIANVNNNTPS